MVETTDSNPVTSPDGQPTQTSGAQGVQPNSSDVDALVGKLMEKLAPELDAKITRAVQSVKDRRISDVQKELSGLQKQLAESMVKAGMTQEKAVEIATQVPTETSSVQAAYSPEQKAVLTEAGIKEDDPDLTNFLKRQFANDVERSTEFTKLVVKKVKPADVSQVSMPSGGAVSRNIGSVTQELTAENMKVNPDRKRLTELQTELNNLLKQG